MPGWYCMRHRPRDNKGSTGEVARLLLRVTPAISFARKAWPNDGAEGETVHLLCDALEALMATRLEAKL